MALQVWNGSEYVGAELGRFGASGTLKEALVWDSAAGQYVKVWPSAPTPITGTFYEVGVNHQMRTSTVHTFADPGTYEINLTLTPPVLTYAVAYLTDSDMQVVYVQAGGAGHGAPSSATAQVEVSAGEQVKLSMINSSGGGGSTVISGTWSITKV